MIKQQRLNYQKYKDLIFERLNSKYNRLWGQLTNMSILFVQIIAGYVFGILAYDTSNVGSLTMFNYATLFVFAIVMGLSLAVGRLELERVKTRRDLKYFLERLE